MTQTARSIAQILALAADNNSQQISPRDLRDIIVTLPLYYGELFISASAATTISDTTSYVDLAGTWDLGQAREFDESGGNGRITYIGAPAIEVIIIGVASLVSAGNNDVVHLRLEKNGTAVTSSDSTQKLATGSAVATLTSIGLTGMSNGDWITPSVRNETSTNDLTANNAHVIVIGMAV